MKALKSLALLLTLLLLNICQTHTASAARRQPLTNSYVNAYFTSVSAASCLGIYLPEHSNEFSYLRSYGWIIAPQTETNGKVEANFAIAHNYFPELGKRIYLVTFRGSASKSDWQINLKTDKVSFGGSTLAEMDAISKLPVPKDAPAVHEGFNTYADTVLRTSVVDADSQLMGVFRTVKDDPDAYLVLTGHSLGGAVATLIGERLIDLGLPKEKFVVVTFGAPAIGNAHFAAQYADRINLLRITNTADPVPGSLQTFFGGYKQFGQHIKYQLSTKIDSIQHDMAMYFDYSISEFYKEFDYQVKLGRLRDLPEQRLIEGEPLVAVWLQSSQALQKVAYATDIRRLMADSYKKMLPSYCIMNTELDKEAYTQHDLIEISRNAGADYVLVCGIDGDHPQDQNYWYLTQEQALFDKDGRMLTMASLGKKVSPAVGNIQATGENMLEARAELARYLPFIITTYKPLLGAK